MLKQGAYQCFARTVPGYVHLDGPCRCFVGGPAPAFISFSNGKEKRVYLTDARGYSQRISWRSLGKLA